VTAADCRDRCGRADDAGREYKAAADAFRSLCDGGPAGPFDRAGLAGAENNQGLAWGQLGRPAAAEACFRAARAKFAKLATEFPDRAVYVSETANCCHNLADVLAEAGRDDEAEKTYREALTLRRRPVAMDPGVPAYRRELARTQAALAAALLRRGLTKEAGELAAAAAAGRERLAAEFPAIPAYRFHLACSLQTVAEWQAAVGQTAEAVATCDRAAGLLRPLAGGSEVPAAPAELARVHRTVGTVLADPGKPAEAERALREAAAVADRLPGLTPFDRQTRTICRLALARLLRSTGRADEAERLIREVAPDEPPAGPTDRVVWAQARCELGESALRAGRPAEAEAAFRSALDAAAGDAPAVRDVRRAAAAGLARVAAGEPPSNGGR
jgi:tetratricopeptide (TPR) repeat protein